MRQSNCLGGEISERASLRQADLKDARVHDIGGNVDFDQPLGKIHGSSFNWQISSFDEAHRRTKDAQYLLA